MTSGTFDAKIKSLDELESILSVALECAREAGEVLRRCQAEGFGVSSKSAKHDLVTTADLESERLIVRRIRETWPRHDVEGGAVARPGVPQPQVGAGQAEDGLTLTPMPREERSACRAPQTPPLRREHLRTPLSVFASRGS